MTPVTELAKSKPAEADQAALMAQIDTLKADVARLTAIIGDMGKAQAQAAADSVRERAEAARKSAEEMTAEALGFIKDKPGTAVGIAAAVGFVLGLLSSRR